MGRIDLLKNDGYWRAVIECGLEDGNLVGVILNLKNELVKLIEAREHKEYFASTNTFEVDEDDDYWGANDFEV